MDSRKIVNDIVNKWFSKAKDSIREELVNRIVTKVESMGPEVINEKLRGIATKVALALGGAAVGKLLDKGKKKAGEKIKKFFTKAGRAERKKEKEDKEELKTAKASKKLSDKTDKKAREGIQNKLDAWREKLDKATDDEEKKKIRNAMDRLKQSAVDAGIGWKKKASRGFRKGQQKAEIKKGVEDKLANVPKDVQ